MARSRYVYLVFHDREVIATFTVKHEMKTFIDKNFYAFRYRLEYVRYPDGGQTGKEPEVMHYPFGLEN